jgi:hypothetical protein
MSSKAFRLCIVCLFLVPFAVLAEAPTAASGCNMQLIDLTDPALTQRLANLTLVPSGPMTKEYKSSGIRTTIKVTRGEFTAVDVDGQPVDVAVECTLTCSGSSCLQSGCEPSGNGCSQWNCGSDCTGSCTQRSVQADTTSNGN